VFAWYDFDVGRIDVHVDTKQPDSGSNARSFYQRYDVTDESAAIWLAHKARR
jgi:hypothetical protein